MLPTMNPMDKSRTKGARLSKCFEEVRIGPVRLYFSHFVLIGFQVDGSSPVVCAPTEPQGVGTPGFVLQHRQELAPDKSTWLEKVDFEIAWEKASAAVLR